MPSPLPTGTRDFITWQQWHSIQQTGMTAYMFEKDSGAVYAFKSAIADTMPGVYPEDININLVLSLGGDINILKPEKFPTLAPTRKPRPPGSNDDDAYWTDDLFTEYVTDDYSITDDFTQPTRKPTTAVDLIDNYVDFNITLAQARRRAESATMPMSAIRRTEGADDDDSTPVGTTDSIGLGGRNRQLFLGTTPQNPSGIAINYNVSLPINRLGYTDADLCHAVLAGQLYDSIASGNFSSFIQAEAINNGASFMTNASSSSSDFAPLNYVRVQTGYVTRPPTSYPTATPSRPTVTPTAGPTVTPEGPQLYHEIVAGIVLTSCALGLFFVTSIVVGLLRVDKMDPPRKKAQDIELQSLSNDYDEKVQQLEGLKFDDDVNPRKIPV